MTDDQGSLDFAFPEGMDPDRGAAAGGFHRLARRAVLGLEGDHALAGADRLHGAAHALHDPRRVVL